jgi:hypothetical protein
MAELKHTFTSGRMDKDRDERLIENGSYRDALNVHVSSSEGSDVGAVENLKGNLKISELDLKNPKTIGSVPYTEQDKLYWLITSDKIDGIYEYDQNNSVINPILIDIKNNGKTILKDIIVEANDENEFVIDNVVASELSTLTGLIPTSNGLETLITNNLVIEAVEPSISVSIPKNTVLRMEDDKFVFKNIHYSGQNYGNVNLTFNFTSEGVLNFSKNNLVTGINIIDDMLFWTDNFNSPRKINLPKFKKWTKGVFSEQTEVVYITKDANGNVVENTRAFTEEDLSVAKKAPMSAPSVLLSRSLTDGVTQVTKTLEFFRTAAAGAAHGRDAIQIGQDISLFFDNEVPNWPLNSTINIIETLPEDNGNALEVSMQVKSVDLNIKKIVLTLRSKNIDFEDKLYGCQLTLDEGEAIYEKTFVRFGYRWKYKDGEYSTISPFSEPAFIAKQFNYDGKEAHNLGMENDLRKIILSNFELGTDNVDEVEVLYKEAKNQNIYTLKSQKKVDFPSEYIITKKQIHSVLPNDQLLRAWDNVPKKAKAQEVTANRVVYGNYVQGYDIYNDIDINSTLIKRSDGLKRTLKSNRTYQIGVSYIDEYNRHTPILSNDTGAVSVAKDQSSFENQFEISLANNPPAWAKYFKYYVKDISKEYYNLAADRIYRDEENGFVYISFPSGERNKITEESYLFLKKDHGSDTPITDPNNRYKIIDITAEAPDFVATKSEKLTTFDRVRFSETFGDGNAQDYRTNGSPNPDSISFNIESVNAGTAINESEMEYLVAGNSIRFVVGNKKTKKYVIAGVKAHTDGAIEANVTVKEAFENDVEILYTGSESNSPIVLDDSQHSAILMEVFKDTVEKGHKEFDGRFFIKLRDVGALSTVAETISNKEYVKIAGYRASGNAGEILSNLTRRDKTPPINRTMLTMHVKPRDDKKQFRVEELFEFQAKAALKSFKTRALVRLNDDDTIYRIESVNRYKSVRDYENVEFNLSDLDGNFVDLSGVIPERNTSDSIVFNFLKEVDEEVSFIQNPAIFETEPIENVTELDIYFETEKAFKIEDHGKAQILNWYNAFSFGNGVESNRIRDDFNETYISTGVKASASISEKIEEQHKSSGLIWSGIVNGRTGVNESNQFNQALPITKDLLPTYGAVQKLHALDSRIIILCEDKILRALSDKDILYNADGNPNIVATNKVIGAVEPYAGEYGISTNPESFASYGFRYYFTDKKRGAVLRGSADGIEVISRYLMSDFFNDRFFNSGCYNSNFDNSFLIGSYDQYNKLYNLSFIGRDTVCFDDNTNGWSTRKSFVPEFGVSLNNLYYTYNLGQLWEHDNINVPYNNFYGQQYNSILELEINENPSVIKSYKTLGYEGTNGWYAKIVTDQQKSSEIYFKDKENKFFANINGEKKTVENINPKNFNFQGIGKAKSISSISAASSTNLSFELSPKTSEKYTSKEVIINNSPGAVVNEAIEIKLKAVKGYKLSAAAFKLKNVIATQDGDDITIRHTHGIKTHPTVDTKKIIELCKINFAEKKQINANGNYKVNLTNVTSTIGDGTFEVEGNSKVLKTIVSRTITPDYGYELKISDIKDNNPNVKLTKKLNPNGSITLTEKIVIPEIPTTDINYEITAIANIVKPKNKKISSVNTNKEIIRENNNKRTVEIFGDPGARFKYQAREQGANVLDELTNQVIPPGGVKVIPVEWPVGESFSIFEVEVEAEGNTDVGVDVETLHEIERPAVEAKTISIFTQWNDLTSDKSNVQGFTYDAINSTFSCTLYLASGQYTVGKQPIQTDFVFDNSTDNISLTNLNLAYVSTHHSAVLTGTISVDNITVDNKIVLLLDQIINEDVELTIDYSTTILGGVNTTDYTNTVPHTPYVIEGPSTLIASNAEVEYLFTLDSTNAHEFLPTIKASDFHITDGVDDVTSIYSAQGKMKLKLESGVVKVGFTTGKFKLPLANKTIYVRPKTQITRAIVVDPDYSLLYTFNNEEIKGYTDTVLQGSLTDISNQDFLFQKTFKIDRNKEGLFAKTFTSSGHTITYLDPELQAAAANTYTDINGNQKTVTGNIEINEQGTELTVNSLANISSVASKKIGKVLVELATEETSFEEFYLLENGCYKNQTIENSKRVKVWNPDRTVSNIQVGARITSYADIAEGVDNQANLERVYKIYGSDLTVTLRKNNAIDIDRVIGVSSCPKLIEPNIVINDIIKTFGDPKFTLQATSESPANYAYEIADSNVATIEGAIVTITGAGTTMITVTQEAKGEYDFGAKKAVLKVLKADPNITAANETVVSSADDFDIIINQP